MENSFATPCSSTTSSLSDLSHNQGHLLSYAQHKISKPYVVSSSSGLILDSSTEKDMFKSGHKCKLNKPKFKNFNDKFKFADAIKLESNESIQIQTVSKL